MEKNRKKSHRDIIVAVLGINAAIAVFWLWLTPWVWYDHSPKPLGEKMEYIGKKDYGCWLGFCDAKPGATYYYATDMSLEEVEGYFRGAKVNDKPKREGFSNDNNFIYRFSFKPSEDNQNGFYFFYYTDGPQQSSVNGFPATSKNHLIQLDYTNYVSAKDAL